MHWANAVYTGLPVLAQYWPNTLRQHWPNAGPALAQHWGSTTCQYWPDSQPLCSVCIGPMPFIPACQYWPSTGPILSCLLGCWSHDTLYAVFLSNRPQCVRVGDIKSPVLVSNTGAPQGCVLSPFLYTMYTNDCRSVNPSTQFVRFSDDTAMLLLLSDFASYQSYLSSVVRFSSWCRKKFCI